MFIPIWGNDPIWLIFFRWVETTNQNCFVEPYYTLSLEVMVFQKHPSISDGFKYGPSLVWKLKTTCPNRKVASCEIHQKLRCVSSPPYPLSNWKSEITTWWDTRSPIIMVQWKIAVSELVTLYTIFRWTMFMGGKVVSCCFLHTVDGSETPNNHLGWC